MSKVELSQIDVEISLDYVNKLYNELKKAIGNRAITRENMMMILITSMQLVEKYKNISGNKKKDIVIKVLDRLINDSVKDEKLRSDLKIIVDTLLPTLIDTIINVDVGKTSVKVKKCWTKIFPCCS